MKHDAELVTVATVEDPAELSIVKGRLEARGIACDVLGECIRVNRAQADKASDFLRENEALSHRDVVEEEHAVQLHCPSCKAMGTNLKRVPSMGIIILSFVTLAGVPLLFMKRGWKCAKCGHHWKGRTEP